MLELVKDERLKNVLVVYFIFGIAKRALKYSTLLVQLGPSQAAFLLSNTFLKVPPTPTPPDCLITYF